MLVSNTFIDFNLQIVMDNTLLQIVDSHRHLGVTLTSNNKWSKHIDTIIASASKQLAFLRKVKYRFSSEILNKLYCTYIRPLLEYASEVWDVCTQTDANRLEQVQLTAARIVTGLPVFASRNSLYSETGWETLSERRRQKRLSLMYKIVNNNAPSYLIDLLPSRVESASNYNLRNRNNYEIPFTRLCSFESSFYPSTLRQWNDLEDAIRNAPTLSQFKRNLRQLPVKPHAFQTSKQRALDIMLTRIRHNSSSLNGHLYRVNIVTSPKCQCGSSIEDTQHYFFNCPRYTDQRNILVTTLNFLANLNIDILTYGNSELDSNTNIKIKEAVLKYIRDTQRFT